MCASLGQCTVAVSAPTFDEMVSALRMKSAFVPTLQQRLESRWIRDAEYAIGIRSLVRRAHHCDRFWQEALKRGVRVQVERRKKDTLSRVRVDLQTRQNTPQKVRSCSASKVAARVARPRTQPRVRRFSRC